MMSTCRQKSEAEVVELNWSSKYFGLKTFQLPSHGADRLLYMNDIVSRQSLMYDMSAHCGSLIKYLNLCH